MTRRLAILLGCTMLLLAAALPAEAQDAGVDFVAEPVPGSQTAKRGGYFLIESQPGRRVTQRLGLRNDSGRPLTLKLAPVDGTTGVLGGVSYGLPDDPVRRVGRWISLERRSLVLQPGGSAIVPFTVRIPMDIAGGEHVGGIAVWSPVSRDAGEASGGPTGASVIVQTRRIVAVQVNVPGPKRPQLVISGVQAAARPNGVYLDIEVANRGTGFTTGRGFIALPDEGFRRKFVIDTFVPATSIDYPVKWSGSVDNGEYAARVEIAYDGGVARWSGEVTVGDKLQRQLSDRQAGAPAAGGVPLLALAAAAAVLAANLVLLSKLRARMGSGGAIESLLSPRRGA